MTLLDLRKLSIRKQTTIRFKLRNGMECVISEFGIAQVPAWKGIPDFNLENELAVAEEFELVAPALVAGKGAAGKGSKDAVKPAAISRAQMAAMAGGGSAASHAEPDHDDE